MEIAPLSSVNVLVTGCIFINNSADPPSHLSLSTTNLFERQIFSGRGGGMVLPVRTMCPLDATISNNVFMNNYAGDYGGGLYCLISGTVGNQTWMIGNNSFIGNHAGIGSGTLNFGNYGTLAPSSTLHSTMYNCTFEHNRAQTGGCLHILSFYTGFTGTFIILKQCMFLNNTSSEIGGAIDVTSYNLYQSRQYYVPVKFIDW